MNSFLNDLCLIAGDFNEILNQQDKQGGRKINSRRCNNFWNCLNNCNIIDLEFKGCKQTWSNHRRERNDLILEKIDQDFANKEWIVKYPNAQVTHLPKTHYDHNPFVITLIKPYLENQFKTFRLKKFLLEYPDFKNLVERCWINKDFSNASSLFEIEAKLWSRNTFGNIF